MKRGVDTTVIDMPETHPTISDSIKKIISTIEKKDLTELNHLLSIPAVQSKIAQDDPLKFDLLKKAAEHGCLRIVNRILEIESVKEALPQCKYFYPYEILRMLLNKGFVDIINRLADLNEFSRSLPNILPPEEYRDLLIKAIEQNDLSMVAVLIKFHPAIYIFGYSEDRICNQILAVAAKYGNATILKLLYDKFKTRNEFEISVEVLQWAAMQGQLQAVEYLLSLPPVLKKAADNNNCALRKASENGHFDVVKCLLKCRNILFNVAAYGNYAFRLAKQNGHEAVVEYLCQFDDVREYIESENALKKTQQSAMPKDLSYEPLDWHKRPEHTQNEIASAFKSVNEDEQSKWGIYNGNEEYGMSGISEHRLIKTIIKNNPDRKEFYVLDIGAGNFQFGRALARFLNNDRDIPKDIKVNIIGIRGEKNNEEAESTVGICKLHEFGSFPVENLVDEFAKRGLNLKNKVDAVVSRWCFRHLVDPLGTFLQAYSLLRPITGFLSMDGFLFERTDTDGNTLHDYNSNMDLLLLESGAPFMIQSYDAVRSLDRFILRRPNEKELRIPLSYITTVERTGRNGSHTTFKKATKVDHMYPQTRRRTLNSAGYGLLIGDKEIFDFLSKNDLFFHSDFEPEQLHKDPEYLGSFLCEHHDISRYVDKDKESMFRVKEAEQEVCLRTSQRVCPSSSVSSSGCSLSRTPSLPAADSEMALLPPIPSSSDDSNLNCNSPLPTRPAIQEGPVKPKRKKNTADTKICSQSTIVGKEGTIGPITRSKGIKRKPEVAPAAPVTPLFSLEARKNRRKNNAKKATSLPSTLKNNDESVCSRTRSQCKRRK